MSSFLRTPKEKESPNKNKFLLENGGRLFQELITSSNGKYNPIKFFSSTDLMKATNNYNPQQILHDAGLYRLYRGTHKENRFITVKKFVPREPDDYDRYLGWSINEIVMVSQLKHGNIFRLLGCCIENEIPMLVYEFASNGVLSDHIYKKKDTHLTDLPMLSWENRLRIATEIADSVTYLHVAASRPIIHRDIKSKNIFMDEDFVAKLAGLTLSITIPLGETHVEDNIKGTVGFIAPDYVTTHRITEKTDVFSFGVLLIELLTGQMPKSLSLSTEENHEFQLPDYVRFLVESNRLSEIVAPTLLRQGGIEQQLQAFAELALRCTKEMANDRPTMMEVAQELRQIKMPVQP